MSTQLELGLLFLTNCEMCQMLAQKRIEQITEKNLEHCTPAFSGHYRKRESRYILKENPGLFQA